MQAKSISGNTLSEIKSALEQSMTGGFKPTLAVVLASVTHDRNEISNLFDDAGITVFGATTNGSFTDSMVNSNAAAILLLDINPDYFCILFEEYPGKNYREVAAAMAVKTLERFRNPAFLIAGSHLETDAEQLLFGFEDIMGGDVNIHGCMAGNDFSLTEQFVFTFKNETNRGIVMLALDQDKITVKSRATCGWKAVGTVKTVTKSIGNSPGRPGEIWKCIISPQAAWC